MSRVLRALALYVLAAAPQLGAQSSSLSGRVTDSQSGLPVPGAQVLIAELNLRAVTRQNGSYVLVNVPPGIRTVMVRRIGYREARATVEVGGDAAGAVQDFQLTEEALKLDEVIVTGTAGGEQRRAIGNAVATVAVAEVTEQVAVTTVQDLLSGRARGLQFARLSGNVGTGSPIRVRGVGSFNLSSNPLIYVDGVRVNNSSRAGPTLGTDFGAAADETGAGDVNVLDDFNPEDIESVEIIKGPAAASLYGTEASAGVIQIITKKGREGTPEFTLSTRQGFNFMTDPAGRLGTMYACTTRFAPGCPVDSIFAYNMYEEANRYIREGYFPWPTRNLYQHGHVQSYNLDVRGGTQAVRYFVAANFDREEGVEWYNWDKTFRARGNISVVLSENWSLDVSTGYVDGVTRFGAPGIRDGGTWQDLRWANGYCLRRVNPNACPDLGGFQERLPSEVAKIESTRNYNRFTGGATLNSRLGGWLSQRLVFGLDKGWEINQILFPKGVPHIDESVEGQINYARPITTNLSLDYSATADLDLGQALTFATSVGAQYYIERFDHLSTVGSGFPSPLSRTINQTTIERLLLDYDFIENKSLGLYVQEKVGWKDRFFLTGALRFDDNSAFGANFEAQTYPKISATWVISEEPFWKLGFLNSLRLRGAWGKAGRQPDAFAARNVYQVMPGPGGSAAIRPASPGNADVGPEVSNELEAGFDAALWRDRISGEFTYFLKRTADALLGVPAPPSLGFPGTVDQNMGRIDNWGWEASMRARIIDGRDVSFELALGADHTTNEIKELGTFQGTRAIRVGFPYPNQTTDYRVVSAQYDPSGRYRDHYGRRISAMCDSGVKLGSDDLPNSQRGVRPGGQPAPCHVVGDLDLLVGPAFPTYTFTVAPTLSLFNNAFQLFALAEGQYGRWGQENAAEWGHIYNNTLISRTEDDPMWVAGDRLGDDLAKQLYDGDFWKLREIGLRFTLPASLVSRFGAERALLSVSGRNLWTLWQAQPEIWGVKVSDPEFGTPTVSGDSNFWVQPPFANATATLRVTF